MQRNQKNQKETTVLCIVPVVTAMLLIFVPSFSESIKILLLGVALLAAGLLGRRRAERDVLLEPVKESGRPDDRNRDTLVIGEEPGEVPHDRNELDRAVPLAALGNGHDVGGGAGLKSQSAVVPITLSAVEFTHDGHEDHEVGRLDIGNAFTTEAQRAQSSK